VITELTPHSYNYLKSFIVRSTDFLGFIFMLATASSPHVTVNEVVAQIFCSRCITRADQRAFMTLLSKGLVTDEEQKLINRVYEGLRTGHLRVTD
jgi:hypothetical protein